MIFISEELESSTKKCHICGSGLDEQSLKPRPCNSQVCEFIFEESQTGSVLTELKHYPNESLFDLSIAGKALTSSRVGQIFEPFPSFYLKKNEMRDKRGNLDEIKKRQLAGQDVAGAKKTDESNKNVADMATTFCSLPSVKELTAGVNTEEELIKKLQT